MNVDRSDIQNVLSQMRSLKSQMPMTQNVNQVPVNFADQMNKVQDQINSQTTSAINNDVLPVQKDEGPSFGDMFKSAIDTVNDSQSHAKDLSTRFEQGDPKVDLPEVMIALQKSSVSFQAMTQVRNKMIEAYKEIMNMPL